MKIQVIDATTEKGLSFVNVSYRPSDQKNWKLIHTDENGYFSYVLSSSDSIHFNFTYLGYQKTARTFTCTDNAPLAKKVALLPSAVWISEVVITESLPAIVQKQDTTIYNVDEFMTGREEKLKEVLNKLPGVHVDRNNEITFKGEKVKEVLIEGKTFFTGDAALAVKYIPAEVVQRIEILEKYNNIKILKGQDSGDRLALNVQLKEDRDKFIFGDLHTGSNADQRHNLHANAFYYSPRLTSNSIGNYSTTEQSALTTSEMIRLIGVNLEQYDPRRQVNGLNDLQTFQRYFTSNQTFDQKAVFGVTQIQYNLKNNSTLEGILLGIDRQEKVFKNRISSFVDQSESIERKFTDLNNNSQFVKLDFKTDTQKKHVLFYNWQYNPYPTEQMDTLQTSFLSQTSSIQQEGKTVGSIQHHRGTWIQQWRPNLQTIIQVQYLSGQNKSNDDWVISTPQVPTFYPLTASNFDLEQIQKLTWDKFYVLGRFNFTLSSNSRLVYFIRSERTYYKAIANAILPEQNGQANIDLSINGFGYSQRNYTEDGVTGVRWFTKHRDWQIKLGLDYLRGHWTNNRSADNHHMLERLAPSLDFARNFNGIGEISLKYEYNFSLPEIRSLQEGYLIQDFNQFEEGNLQLNPQRTHRVGITLNRSKLLKGQYYSASLFYSHVVDPIISEFKLTENNLIQSYRNSIRARNDWMFLLRMQQVNGKTKISQSLRFHHARFFQTINDVLTLLIQYGLQNDLNFSRNTERQELGLQVTLGCRNANLNTTEYEWLLDGSMLVIYDYFISSRWKIGATGSINQAWSKSSKQRTVLLNAQLQYNTKNEKYRFGLHVYNLFNQRWTGENSVTSFVNHSTQYAILPRYMQGKFTYVF